MPQYKNAADVRAAHPGAYDDLTDQQIEQGLAKQAGPAPAATGTPDPFIGRHATSGDTPDSAFIGELARTGKEAALGLARSPWDAVKGFLGLPAQAYKGLTEDLPALLKDPSLLLEADAAARNGLSAITDPKTDPREMGSALGQLILGDRVAPKVPGTVNAALREGPGIVGRGVSAVGRGTEAVGTSKALAKARAYAPLELVTGHPLAAAVSAAAPSVLEGSGKLMQRGGGALEGLDLSIKGKTPFAREAVSNSPQLGPARFSTEKPYQQNGALSNIGPDEIVAPKADAGPVTDSAAFKGLQDAIRKGNQSPIDKFLENDPQAAIGGEGRMTGQFDEGGGGLSDVANGRITPNAMPPTLEGLDPRITGLSPLDELATMSGRKLSPARSQELFNKFKGGR